MTWIVLFGHRVAPVTLFDASLLSTSKPPETAALFLLRRFWGLFGSVSASPHRLETIKTLVAGLSLAGAQ
jgi:hypothetical protein